MSSCSNPTGRELLVNWQGYDKTGNPCLVTGFIGFAKGWGRLRT